MIVTRKMAGNGLAMTVAGIEAWIETWIEIEIVVGLSWDNDGNDEQWD